MINIFGLFVVGECDYLQYGVNCLGVNLLLLVIYGGMVVGFKVVEYINGLEKSVDVIFLSVYDCYVKEEEEKWNNIMNF